jgi:hypothetical protein
MDIDVYRNKWWIMAGKKRIFSAGLVVFVVGSVLCGVAQSIYALILARLRPWSARCMINSWWWPRSSLCPPPNASDRFDQPSPYATITADRRPPTADR